MLIKRPINLYEADTNSNLEPPETDAVQSDTAQDLAATPVSSTVLNSDDWETYYKEYAKETNAGHSLLAQEVLKNYITNIICSGNKSEAAGIIENCLYCLEFEVKAYSWDPEANPFVYFIRHFIVPNKLKFKTLAYDAIHNAFVDEIIGKENLRNFKDPKNILICKDLYNYTGRDMEQYFESYSNITNKYSRYRYDVQYENNNISTLKILNIVFNAAVKIQSLRDSKNISADISDIDFTANSFKLVSTDQLEMRCNILINNSSSDEQTSATQQQSLTDNSSVIKAALANRPLADCFVYLCYNFAKARLTDAAYNSLLKLIIRELNAQPKFSSYSGVITKLCSLQNIEQAFLNLSISNARVLSRVFGINGLLKLFNWAQPDQQALTRLITIRLAAASTGQQK